MSESANNPNPNHHPGTTSDFLKKLRLQKLRAQLRDLMALHPDEVSTLTIVVMRRGNTPIYLSPDVNIQLITQATDTIQCLIEGDFLSNSEDTLNKNLD